MGEDETICQTPLSGTWNAAGATLDPTPDPKASRADEHMAITSATFQEAGWEISMPKVQCGIRINILGLDMTAGDAQHPDGAILCPEAKRLGLINEIKEQRTAE